MEEENKILIEDDIREQLMKSFENNRGNILFSMILNSNEDQQNIELAKKLTFIIKNNAQILKESIAKLFDLIKYLVNLQILSYQIKKGNQIGIQGAKFLSSAVSHTQSLIKLSITICSQNNIQSEGAYQLFKGLGFLRLLKNLTISLYDESIDSKSFLGLEESLQNLKNLEKFKLQLININIQDTFFQHLGNSLKHLNQLTYLDINIYDILENRQRELSPLIDGFQALTNCQKFILKLVFPSIDNNQVYNLSRILNKLTSLKDLQLNIKGEKQQDYSSQVLFQSNNIKGITKLKLHISDQTEWLIDIFNKSVNLNSLNIVLNKKVTLSDLAIQNLCKSFQHLTQIINLELTFSQKSIVSEDSLIQLTQAIKHCKSLLNLVINTDHPFKLCFLGVLTDIQLKSLENFNNLVQFRANKNTKLVEFFYFKIEKGSSIDQIKGLCHALKELNSINLFFTEIFKRNKLFPESIKYLFTHISQIKYLEVDVLALSQKNKICSSISSNISILQNLEKVKLKIHQKKENILFNELFYNLGLLNNLKELDIRFQDCKQTEFYDINEKEKLYPQLTNLSLEYLNKNCISLNFIMNWFGQMRNLSNLKFIQKGYYRSPDIINLQILNDFKDLSNISTQQTSLSQYDQFLMQQIPEDKSFYSRLKVLHLEFQQKIDTQISFKEKLSQLINLETLILNVNSYFLDVLIVNLLQDIKEITNLRHLSIGLNYSHQMYSTALIESIKALKKLIYFQIPKQKKQIKLLQQSLKIKQLVIFHQPFRQQQYN